MSPVERPRAGRATYKRQQFLNSGSESSESETLTEERRSEKEIEKLWMLVWGKRGTILTRSGEGVEMSDFISFPILQPFLSEHSSSARTGGGGVGGGELQRRVRKPSDAYEKLVTLISLRALQLLYVTVSS